MSTINKQQEKEVLHTQGEPISFKIKIGEPYEQINGEIQCPVYILGESITNAKTNAELFCKIVNERQKLLDSNKELLELLEKWQSYLDWKDGKIIKTLDMTSIREEMKPAIHNAKNLQ